MFELKRVPDDEKVELSVNTIDKGHHQVSYRGVNAIRCPFDYVIYQMIISEIKPDLIIEIGTRKGGGAYYMADLLDNIGKGIIHTIDIVDEVEPIVKEHKRIKFFTDGWENYPIELAKSFTKILVIEDASHMYLDSIGALNKFHSLVSKDSYFIVEDGIVNKLGLEKKYDGGPLRAIREFLPNHPDFIVDRKWCDMFGKNATFNVNGYLKKIK